MTFRRALALLLASAWVGGLLHAGESKLPPLSGELAGQLRLPALVDFPSLAWKVQAGTAADGSLQVQVGAEAPGLTLRTDVILSDTGRPKAWRIRDGSIDLASWGRVLAAQGGAESLPPALQLSGIVQLTGQGTWENDQVTGTLTATLENGTAQDTVQGWEINGLTASAELVVAANTASLGKAEVRAATLQASRLTIRNLEVVAVGGENHRIQVQTAQVDALGGHVTLAPFTFDPSAPVVVTTAELSRAALAELAAFVPEALAEAHGEVDGRIAVRWEPGAGAEPGQGSLTVSAETLATVRLAPDPGFFTDHIPPRIVFLPARFGAVARWLSLENPAYDTLKRIELGQTPLVVESLSLQLFPDGPDGARSATVQLVAKPTSETSVVQRITFKVNVAGPLQQVINLGLDQRVSNVGVNVGKEK